MKYRGMTVLFGKTPRLDNCYLVDICVDSLNGPGLTLAPLGYATRVGRKWRAETLRGGVIAVNLRRRADCIHVLYCQRYGNPDMPGHVSPLEASQ